MFLNAFCERRSVTKGVLLEGIVKGKPYLENLTKGGQVCIFQLEIETDAGGRAVRTVKGFNAIAEFLKEHLQDGAKIEIGCKEVIKDGAGPTYRSKQSYYRCEVWFTDEEYQEWRKRKFTRKVTTESSGA